VSESVVYDRLHAAIVASELSPGERLVEEDLATRLGATRGAVRAALLRLAHDGLVVRERHRGAQVRRVTLGEAVEIVEARRALESLAAGHAARRRTVADADELRARLETMAELQARGELLEASARNGELHRRILEISRHQVAIDICGRLSSQLVRFQYRTVLAPGRAAHSIAEHRAIVAAIADGDAPGAEAAMGLHLAHVLEVLRGLEPV
jgi:DNA-binding GntR family transcriptional regulator